MSRFDQGNRAVFFQKERAMKENLEKLRAAAEKGMTVAVGLKDSNVFVGVPTICFEAFAQGREKLSLVGGGMSIIVPITQVQSVVD